jgi:lipid II:glycine glycyltransferase (peptidoglycan interpeptide bridge formation enzyme)
MAEGIFKVVADGEARESWDGWLSGFQDRHFKQTHAWGEFKRARGWGVLRAGLFSPAGPLVLAQCTLKHPLGLAAALAWANGGPVYAKNNGGGPVLSPLRTFLEGLSSELSRRHRLFYLRINPQSPASPDARELLKDCGFKPALAPLATGLSVVLDLSPRIEALHRGLDKKWRNQLRAAQKEGPAFCFGRDEGLLRRYWALHEEMCSLKGLGGQSLSMEELLAMARAFGPMLEIALASLAGKDAAGIFFWRLDRKAYIGYAATNSLGRASYLSNALYWELISRLKGEGCLQLDTCGVDPKKSWGVYNFKRGLGGSLVEFVNEWDLSRPPCLRPAANLGISLWKRAAP